MNGQPGRGSKPPLAETVGEKAERRERARGRRQRSLLFGLGMFGLVGWSIAVPTVLGAMLGVWLDTLYPGPPSWALTLLFIGAIVGCLNAWYWVKRESRDD